MPSYLDLAVLGVILVSALLSLMRGFTREVLAIASWGAAAAAAYYFYPKVMPYASPYIQKEIVAEAVSAAAVFFVTLIIVSLFTVRLSDAILDSKIGALDRSLGFLFGAARGFLLGVVAFAIFNWLVADKQQPEWVKDAKTRPFLQQTAQWIVQWLPDDAERTIEGWLKKNKTTGAGGEEPPPDEPLSAPPADTAAPPPASPPPPAAPSVPSTDKQKLDAIINKPAAPAKPPAPPAKP